MGLSAALPSLLVGATYLKVRLPLRSLAPCIQTILSTLIKDSGFWGFVPDYSGVPVPYHIGFPFSGASYLYRLKVNLSCPVLLSVERPWAPEPGSPEGILQGALGILLPALHLQRPPDPIIRTAKTLPPRSQRPRHQA